MSWRYKLNACDTRLMRETWHHSINNKIRALENFCKGESHDTIATHMLTLMVRGLFFHLNFPYAQFPTAGTISAHQPTLYLMPILNL